MNVCLQRAFSNQSFEREAKSAVGATGASSLERVICWSEEVAKPQRALKSHYDSFYGTLASNFLSINWNECAWECSKEEVKFEKIETPPSFFEATMSANLSLIESDGVHLVSNMNVSCVAHRLKSISVFDSVIEKRAKNCTRKNSMIFQHVSP